MKKPLVYIGSIIILILSVFTFIVFGAGTEIFTAIFGGKNQLPAFGSYDGKKIEYKAGSEFTQNVQQLADQYRNQGYEINTQSEYSIFQQAFTRTINNMAFIDAVEKSGYKVPKSAVSRQMRPYFLDEKGNFSERIFNSTPEKTINDMSDSIKKSLTYSRYVIDMIGTQQGENSLYGIKTSTKAAEYIENAGKDVRSFNMAVFTTDKYPTSEVKKFAEENSKLFLIYNLSAVTMDKESDLKAVYKDVKAGKLEFDTAVAEKSTMMYTDSDGLLSNSYSYEIENILNNTDDFTQVKALEKDAYSNIIKTKQGYTFFKCNGNPIAADFSKESVLNDVSSYISTNEKSIIETYFLGLAGKLAEEAQSKSLSTAAKNAGASVINVPEFNLNYGNSSKFYADLPKEVTDINAQNNEQFFTTAFGLAENEVSQPLIIGDNIVVLQCKKISSKDVDTSKFSSTIEEMNSTSLQQSLFSSKKVVDNFQQVFFNNLYNR